MSDDVEVIPGWDKRITTFFAAVLIFATGWICGIAQSANWH